MVERVSETADPLMAPVTTLPRCGPATARTLSRLSIVTIADLLAHVPVRYRRVLPPRPLSEWGIASERARLAVQVSDARVVSRGRMTLVEAQASDVEGREILLVFFRQPWLAKQLPGRRLIAEGPLRGGARPRLEVREFSDADDADENGESGLRPVYALTEGLSLRVLRRLVVAALDLRERFGEPLPGPIRERFGLVGIAQAYEAIHRPRSPEDPQRGRRRLVFDELLEGQLALLILRATAAHAAPLLAGPAAQSALARVRDGLPFALSDSQRRVSARLARRLERARPARVMVQGEVGSGKTVIAALAIAQALGAGYRAAVLVPTEVLARQHRDSLASQLAPLQAPLELIVSSMPATARREALARLAGAPSVAIGTQALFTDDVAGWSKSLGLLVVDEQHRFGIDDRHRLLERAAAAGSHPHYLQLTATPIPRSLALTALGDLDVLRLAGRPEAARQVATEIVTDEATWAAALRDPGRSGGAFVVCPEIGTEDAPVGVLSADLRQRVLAGIPHAVAHGRQSADERSRALEAFSAGSVGVLVSTTLVEVGIDVPHARLMVVLGADRFGLAQLHQLRGRIGRSGEQARCLLVPSPDANPEAILRIESLVASNDGMALAERDLAVRGAGQISGQRQSGSAGAALVSLTRDRHTLAEARYASRAILRLDSSLSLPAHRLLRTRLAGRIDDLIGAGRA